MRTIANCPLVDCAGPNDLAKRANSGNIIVLFTVQSPPIFKNIRNKYGVSNQQVRVFDAFECHPIVPSKLIRFFYGFLFGHGEEFHFLNISV